jgi:hypothetical protein
MESSEKTLDLTDADIDGSDPTNLVVKVGKTSEVTRTSGKAQSEQNLGENSKKGQDAKKLGIPSNIVGKSSKVTGTLGRSLDEGNLVEVSAKKNPPRSAATGPLQQILV